MFYSKKTKETTMADFKKGQNGQNKDISNKSDTWAQCSQNSAFRQFSQRSITLFSPTKRITQTPIKNNSVKNSKAAKCTGKCDCNCTSCGNCNCK